MNPHAVTPWYRQRWPWLLMAGPFIVAVAATFTAYLAVTRPDALVVGDYYRQGKAINIDLKRDRIAAAKGLGVQLSYDAAAGRISGTLSATPAMPSTTGTPPSIATRRLHLQLVHSTLPEKDLHMELSVDAEGRFSAPLAMLDMARWQVVVEDEQREWRLAGVWQWPQKTQIALHADQDGLN